MQSLGRYPSTTQSWVENRLKLDSYYHEVATIILSKQNAATGLLPASVAITTHGDYRDAWVRDNVYSIMAVWALALAYKRLDDDLGRAVELEYATIKCMRGLLVSMMRQSDKVEQFKNTQSLEHSLHAKYNTSTGMSVVGDFEWGHLQIDATSLFLLMLAQMTASGLQIVYTLDEVHFIQNLVFYIERAYRTPDYGIWERGNKINHGQPELNSSSIGMAVAALQAMNGLNLFGARGGAASVVHVLPDEITRNYTTLHSALPRESYSKEVDAAILSVISFPAFAVQDPILLDKTRAEIIKKLGGQYGCKRFLRDGHQTVLEDTSRLHYEPHELTVFENIECEWPLFFTYLILDGLFFNNRDQVIEYRNRLEPLLVDSSRVKYHGEHQRQESNPRPPSASSVASSPRSVSRKLSFTKKTPPPRNIQLVPELYIVPRYNIEKEKQEPGSQERIPNENLPLVWAQSLKILGDLMLDNLIIPADLDPLGRRLLPYSNKQTTDVVVQVVLMAESAELQSKMSMFGLETHTVQSCAPITISTPSALRDAYTALGENSKLGLSGRPKRPIGTLSTCKLYRCQGRLYAFLPHFMDREEFYLVSDNDYLVTLFEQELQFVKNHWTGSGRPTLIIMLTEAMLGGLKTPKYSATSPGISRWRYGSASGGGKRNLLNFMMSLRSGVCAGVRVRLGRLTEMVNTSCIESLDFLVTVEHSDQTDWHALLEGDEECGEFCHRLQISEAVTQQSGLQERSGVTTPGGSVRRTGVVRKASADVGNTTPRSGCDPSFIGCKSPLTSSFYSDDPNTYGALEELDLDKPHKGLVAAVKESLQGRSLSPVRGVASNRSANGLFTEKDSSQLRRSSYSFDVLPTSQTTSDVDHLTPTEHPTPDLPPSTSPEPSEMLTLTLNDPSRVSDAIQLLKSSSNLYDQIDILHYLHSCQGPQFHVQGLGIIHDLLEEVYVKAMQLKQWSIVRQAAGLLRKVVNSLTINVTDLLIRQKPVTVGFGSLEYFIASPQSPAKLADIIYKHCVSDVREAPLVQEVMTYLGSFIRSSSSLFDGIMRIRTHFFIIAMREEISRMRSCDEEEAVEHLMQLSPFEMKSLLGQVLNSREQTSAIPTLTETPASKWRQIQVANPSSVTESSLKQSDCTSGSSLPDQLLIHCQSGGFQAGNFARIEVSRDGKGQAVPSLFGRGLNIVVFDPLDGMILETASFDTHSSAEDSDEFAKMVEWLEPGALVVVVSKDDCFENLTEAAKAACESLGSSHIRQVHYRDSWCLIGEKGAEKGSAAECLKPASHGPTPTVTRTFDLASRRKKMVPLLSSAKNGDVVITTGAATNVFLPSNGRWLRSRKNDGALNRTPPNFYPKVWTILSKCKGVMVGRQTLPSHPTVNEKTPEEFNFALQVESLLDVIRDPAERQMAVDCISVIAHIHERNPEIQLRNDILDLTKAIRDAVYRHWCHWVKQGKMLGLVPINEPDSVPATPATPLPIPQTPTTTPATQLPDMSQSLDASFERNERFARRLFYDLPQDGNEGTMAYLASSCVKLLFDVKWNPV